MIFQDSRFQLVIAILDDRGDSREAVMNTIVNAGLEYFDFGHKVDLMKYLIFKPEEEFTKLKLRDNEYMLTFSTYKKAKKFLRSDEKRFVDLIIIDVDWAPGTGNTDGITLGEIVHEEIEFAKLFFTGSDKKVVEQGIKEKIPDILTQGKRFYPEIFLKPDDFKNKKFRELLDYTMGIFRRKRAKFLKENCHSPGILNLIGKSSLEGSDFLSIRDNYGNYQKTQLKDIFFECRTPDQFKEELQRCYHARSRFYTLKNFWSNEDIKLPSHMHQNPFKKKAEELLTAGEYRQSLNKATTFYYEEIRPELGIKEITAIEDFFKEINKLLNDLENSDKSSRAVKNTMSDIIQAGKMLKRKTRLYLDELRYLFGTGDNVQLDISRFDSEWFCYVGECEMNSPPLILSILDDDGVKGHLMAIWDLFSIESRQIKDYDIRKSFGLILIEIRGKLLPDSGHSNNGGAFDLHKSTLAERIMKGNNLKKFVELLPYYFNPFLVESYGSDSEWHCVNFSTGKEALCEIINPEEFSNMTGLYPMNQGKEAHTGVRFLMGIEKI